MRHARIDRPAEWTIALLVQDVGSGTSQPELDGQLLDAGRRRGSAPSTLGCARMSSASQPSSTFFVTNSRSQTPHECGIGTTAQGLCTNVSGRSLRDMFPMLILDQRIPEMCENRSSIKAARATIPYGPETGSGLPIRLSSARARAPASPAIDRERRRSIFRTKRRPPHRLEDISHPGHSVGGVFHRPAWILTTVTVPLARSAVGLILYPFLRDVEEHKLFAGV